MSQFSSSQLDQQEGENELFKPHRTETEELNQFKAYELSNPEFLKTLTSIWLNAINKIGIEPLEKFVEFINHMNQEDIFSWFIEKCWIRACLANSFETVFRYFLSGFNLFFYGNRWTI